MGKTASVTLGKGSLNHNNRNFSTENVDPALTPHNVVLQRQTLKEAYRELFGGALEAYNQKQTRDDRKIQDYLEHIRKSGNGEKLYHELIIQVGNREDTGLHTADAELAKEILTRYFREFQVRNPTLRVFNAVIHMDEPNGTPHLHLDFIPTATGQKRGLDTKNSMRQALHQLGFDFQPIPVNDNPNLSVTYGKPQPKIGGGRWVEAERAALGALLERQGIPWDRMNTHRSHETVREFKVCGEMVERMVRQTPPTPVELRTPTAPMKLAGVKADEVLVRRAAVEGLRQESATLRAQAEINRQTITKMDAEKAETDAFVQRTIKSAEHETRRVRQEADAVKAAYSNGTAEQYRALEGKYRQTVDLYHGVKARYEAVARQNTQLAASIPQLIQEAVHEAVRPLREENDTLRTELERWRRRAEALQARVRDLCQTLHDALRAMFTLKYNFQDKRHNPYRSDLTAHASALLDAVEDSARRAMDGAELPDLAKGLSSMGVTEALERDVRRRIPAAKGRGHAPGE